MARHQEAPFYVRSQAGRAILDFSTTEGRQRVSLGLPLSDRPSPSERRAAEQAGEIKWRELTEGRVIAETARVKTGLTFQELYALYIERWEPGPDLSVNAREKMKKALVVRRGYGATIMEWASDEAVRPDGSKRWRSDSRTPLERVIADDGPADFLGWRLTRVRRKSMRKEKSNLVQFLTWAKAHGYLATVPRVELPDGKGVAALTNGRGVHIRLTPLLAAQLVAVMPEMSSRVSRINAQPFLVRPMFEFMNETGLREATIERLEVPRNWAPGRTSLTLDNDDDKAAYGRELHLPKGALAILNKYAPESGHIFGHHDWRRFVKDAAAIVFEKDPQIAKLFGGYHFRHFVGTFLANRAGTNLAAASFVMGHTDLSTTSIYVHADEDAARALLKSTERERSKASREAEAWAKKKVREIARKAKGPKDSDKILSRTPRPLSTTDAGSAAFSGLPAVGARGFEPPTPRPPV